MESAGKILILTGTILVIAGVILWLGGDKFSWLGNLPGDIKIQRKNFSLYFPITTMILISIVISLLFWIIRKLW